LDERSGMGMPSFVLAWSCDVAKCSLSQIDLRSGGLTHGGAVTITSVHVHLAMSSEELTSTRSQHDRKAILIELLVISTDNALA